MSDVFCDKLNLSFPPEYGAEVRSMLGEVFDMAGAHLDITGKYRFATNGTADVKLRYGVLTAGLSGAALAAVRAAGLYRDLLAGVVQFPHKVTQIHVSMDVEQYAPPILEKVYQVAKAGKVHLSRKAIRPGVVRYLKGVNEWGHDTGTVYLGSKKAECYGYVYDKQKERLDNALEHIGPLTRFEMGATHKFGVSLRDAELPSSLFYHLASPGLLDRPQGVAEWYPGALGFKLPPRVPALPAQRLIRLLESSPDIRRALELAEQIGPEGMAYLHRRLDTLHDQLTCAPLGTPGEVAAPAARSSPAIPTM